MAEHLKTRIIERLKSTIATFEPLPPGSTPHKRGVHYFRACVGVDCLWGAMDMAKEGRQYKKRIVVRPARFRDGLFELYTYHIPKQWSAACVANRELIKEAQRRAHALERDCSTEGLEWRIRFFKHYYAVVRGGAKPEEGMKRYSRFYQYVYVAIYRRLKAAAEKPAEALPSAETQAVCLLPKTAEISFTPIRFRPKIAPYWTPLRRAYNYLGLKDLQPPDLQRITNPPKIHRTSAEFAYVAEKQ